MNPFRRLILVGAALLGVTGWALADSTGTLIVKTVDNKGVPMPGVIVLVENNKGITTPPAKTTDGTGTATFLLPAGGGYKVTVSAPTYNSIETVDFKIELGKTKTILYTMQEQLRESVKVHGGKVVDLDEGAEGKVTFTDQFVEDLPVLGHSYQNVLTLAPGVNDLNGDGNPNVHGARERDFKATVDGVSNVDPLTGTFMSNINPDAIEEIEVVTTGAGAEYGRAVGGFGKIITKQGGNTFETVASVYLRSYLLDGNATQTEGADKIEYHDVRPALNLTGPVIKDKLFFALFHEYRDVGRPVNLASGGGLVVKTKGSLNTDKLTWQASPRNKFIFQAQADPIRRGPAGVDSFTDPRAGYDRKQGGPTYQLRWNAQVNSVLNVESLGAVSHTGIDLIPVSENIKSNCFIDNPSVRRREPFGGVNGQPIDEDYCRETRTERRSGSFFLHHIDDRIRYTLKSDATYFMENLLGVSHTLKGGVVIEKERYSSTDVVRSFSLFNEVTSSGGGVDEPAVVGGGFDLRTVYQPGYPDNKPNSADGITYGVYLEDQFRPHPNVSLRLGMRVERENVAAPGFAPFDPRAEALAYDAGYARCIGTNPNPPRAACASANLKKYHKYERWPTIGTNPLPDPDAPTAQIRPREAETFRISNTNLGPRFSISWDPRGDQKTKLFASAGRLYDKIFLGIPTYEQGPDTFDFLYEVDHDACVIRRGQQICPPGGVNVLKQNDNSASVSPATIYQVDRKLRTPYNDEYTAGFSREIAPETSVTVTYILRHFRDQFQAIDINHFAQDRGTVRTFGCYEPDSNGPTIPVDPTPDGVFDDCGGRLISLPGPNGQATRRAVPDGIPDLFIYNPFFNQIFRIGNYNTTEYTAYQLEVVRRLHRNWQLEGSYVWSRAVGNAEDFVSSLGQDPTTIKQEFGPLSFDQTHFAKVNVTTTIPLWNIRLGSSFNWASGPPYSTTETYASPDQKRNFGPYGVAYPNARTIYPSRQRNDSRNDSYWLFNVNAKKEFTVGKANVEASLEIFNLLNADILLVQGISNKALIAQKVVGRQYQFGTKFSF